MSVPKFQFEEFKRLLMRITNDKDATFHCRPETICTLSEILYTNYPYQCDDIEYLMDMINYYIRKSKYTGSKSRFPISKYLDEACSSEFYISSSPNKLITH